MVIFVDFFEGGVGSGQRLLEIVRGGIRSRRQGGLAFGCMPSVYSTSMLTSACGGSMWGGLHGYGRECVGLFFEKKC